MRLGTLLYKRMKKIRLMLGLNSQNLSFKDLRKVVKVENILQGQLYFRAADKRSLSRLSWAEGRVTPKTIRKFITSPHRESNNGVCLAERARATSKTLQRVITHFDETIVIRHTAFSTTATC